MCMMHVRPGPSSATSIHPWSRASYLAVAEATDDVVIHHVDRLHVRVADRRSDERKSSLPQVGAHRVRLLRPRGNLPQAPPTIHLGPIADERPHVPVECPEFLLDREERFRILDRRGDLEAFPDDSGIAETSRNFPGPILRAC